ncbi:MAG: exodeoxyribonuclease VII small subunit [Gemmatimonadaceae bacterium]
MSFETSVQRLDAIVRELEGGDLALERALALFEEAVKELRTASEALASADAKVKLLAERADGAVTLTDFRA